MDTGIVFLLFIIFIAILSVINHFELKIEIVNKQLIIWYSPYRGAPYTERKKKIINL